MMKRFVVSLCAALSLLAGLVHPASAGEWREVPPPRQGMNAVGYFSDKLEPGEMAMLATTPTEIVGRSDSPRYRNALVLLIVLNSGDIPISGFDGVTLRPASGDKELFAFYNYYAKRDGTRAELERLSGNDHPCSTWDVIEMRGNDGESAPAQCAHICYPTLAGLHTQTGDVPCDSGKAYWIAISIVGMLNATAPILPPDPPLSAHGEYGKIVYQHTVKAYEEQQKAIRDAAAKGEPYLFDDAVTAASQLIVKIRHGDDTYFRLTLDDAFRKVLFSRRGEAGTK